MYYKQNIRQKITLKKKTPGERKPQHHPPTPPHTPKTLK